MRAKFDRLQLILNQYTDRFFAIHKTVVLRMAASFNTQFEGLRLRFVIVALPGLFSYLFLRLLHTSF